MPRKRVLSPLAPVVPPAKSSPHPTKERLLTSVVTLMREHKPEAITSEMVLEHSGVSKGSLYHHFEDLGDLIETALVHEFATHVDESIGALTRASVQSKTPDEMWARLERVTEATQGRAFAAVRAQRIRLISLAGHNARFAKRLAVEQARLTDALTDLVRETQLKGWMNKSFDPRAAAVLIQAYTLGRVVDDISGAPMEDKVWTDLIKQMVRKTFG